MDHLHQASLNELMERVVHERLVDACVQEGAYVVITQGAARFILSPSRAHAFLRGVIKGMSARHRSGRPFAWIAGDRAGEQNEPIAPNEPIARGGTPSSGLVDSFRRHLLKKWSTRYQQAGCPFGASRSGLGMWVNYGTFTTAS